MSLCVGDKLYLQDERLKHAETLAALEAEQEKVQMAHTEINVLQKQLEREKATFEKAYVACTFVCVYVV